MIYTIHFLAPATFELNEAFQYYEKIQVGLGVRLVEEIDHFLAIIEENPYNFSLHSNNEELRSFPLKKFPYAVIYWVDDEKKLIYIDSVFHSKRKPRSYKSM